MDGYLVTGNAGKLKEMRSFLADTRLQLRQLEIQSVEPSYRSVEEVARWKIEQAIEMVGRDSVLVADDTGLFVDVLNGFPGPQTAFFAETAGIERLLTMLREEEPHTATFTTALAVFDPATDDIKMFVGDCDGTLVAPRGEDGFGYDPVFLPEDHNKTFAEDTAYKEKVSHRTRALEQFRTWLE